MRVTIVQFLGSNCDHDVIQWSEEIFKLPTEVVWYTESDLRKPDLVLLPGGFSYGDYLRPGAMASRTPAIESVRKFAESGGLVLGICNGFQILCECGLLPGALLRNQSLSFICRDLYLKTENGETPFTGKIPAGKLLKVPIAHGDGNYFCDNETAKLLEAEGRIAFRYVSPEGADDPAWNPNGSILGIAGILSGKKNVLGMMPHPERASERSLGREDGRLIFESIISHLESQNG
jgi:phosphoribosylformylglycinamidine synthase subunit PurQ / glutaminase